MCSMGVQATQPAMAKDDAVGIREVSLFALEFFQLRADRVVCLNQILDIFFGPLKERSFETDQNQARGQRIRARDRRRLFLVGIFQKFLDFLDYLFFVEQFIF